MAIVAADNNGGRYNNVHRQTDDGIVFSVAAGENLMPITFRYTDYLGDCHETLISLGFYPHARLMRGDCGWRAKDDSDALLFSWQKMEHRTDGYNDSPSGEYIEAWHEEPNCAKDVLIDGLRGHKRTFYRKDRAYWTPDTVAQADSWEDPFAIESQTEYNDCCDTQEHGYEIPTMRQWNPITCPPRQPNKCGILEYDGGKH